MTFASRRISPAAARIILDAFLAARFKPWATVTAGKFKVPVGLERLVSANDLRFIERGLPTSLVPNRDLGVQVGSDIIGGVVNYSIGYFNGVSDGSSSDSNTPTADAENDTKGDWAARVFVQPFLNSDNFALRGLGFGVAGTYVNSTGSTTTTLLPSYRTPGQQTFFSYRGTTAASGTTPAVNGTIADGERLRWTPQAYYSLGSFAVLGEYVQCFAGSVAYSLRPPCTALRHARQLRLASASSRGSSRVKTNRSAASLRAVHLPIRAKAGWGAIELVARYPRTRHRRRRVHRRRRLLRQSRSPAPRKETALGRRRELVSDSDTVQAGRSTTT